MTITKLVPFTRSFLLLLLCSWLVIAQSTPVSLKNETEAAQNTTTVID
jgi:hypothetical protein